LADLLDTQPSENTFIFAGQPDSSPDIGITKQTVGDRDSALISYWHLMWALSDVCRLFANNSGSFAINAGRRDRIFAVNPGRKSGCLQAAINNPRGSDAITLLFPMISAYEIIRCLGSVDISVDKIKNFVIFSRNAK